MNNDFLAFLSEQQNLCPEVMYTPKYLNVSLHDNSPQYRDIPILHKLYFLN